MTDQDILEKEGVEVIAADKHTAASGIMFQSLIDLNRNDGVKHIRIDNRGKTQLGRMLDSQYMSPFEIPGLGTFNSTEGLWYYISMKRPPEDFRVLRGNLCRKLIRELKDRNEHHRVERRNFYEIIEYGTYAKIMQNEDLKQRFIENELPMLRFFMRSRNGQNSLMIESTSRAVVFLNDLCQRLKEDINYTPPLPDVSDIVKDLPDEVRQLYHI